MRKPYIIGILIRDKTGPPALAKLNVKEFRYGYHNFRGININDNGLKSSIFFKGYVLLTSGRSPHPLYLPAQAGAGRLAPPVFHPSVS